MTAFAALWPVTHSRPLGRGACGRGRRVVLARVTDDEEAQYEKGAQSYSRRDFILGVAGGAILAEVLWYGPRDDLRSRARLQLLQRFPDQLAWLDDSVEQPARAQLDPTFVKSYMNSIQNVAQDMNIISIPDLHTEEQRVRSRAANFFFDGAFADAVAANPADRDLDGGSLDERWFNFVLYSRLHVVAKITSPKTRLAFIQKLATPILDSLDLDRSLRRPLPVEELTKNSDAWLDRLNVVLEQLQKRGMMSSFAVEEFDGGEGSLWQERGRGSLSVYINGPATMQSAQLIGEEQYEEISPKLSTVLQLVFMEAGIRNVSFEDYYLDNKYAPDPAQYRPSQFAVEFDLNIKI